MKSILLILFLVSFLGLVVVYVLPITSAQENSKSETLVPPQYVTEPEILQQKILSDENQNSEELFNFVGARKETESVTASIASVLEQEININFNAINSDSLVRIRIPLFDGKTYTAIRSEKEGFEWRGLSDYTWRGFIDGKTELSVTLSIKDGAMAGLITSAKGLYEILPQKDFGHILKEVNPNLSLQCASNIQSPTSNKNSVKSSVIMTTGDLQSVPADTGIQIDVMIVYTSAVRNSFGGTAQTQAFAQQAVDSTNTAYLLSGINPRLRLVHSQEINYTETGSSATQQNMETDLAGLYFNQTVKNLRDYYKADHTTLLVKHTVPYTVGGISYGLRKSNFSYVYANESLSVVESSWAVADYAFAHELGHNQGADHNVEDGSSANTNVYPYAYGHRLANTFKTIMSYPGQLPLPPFPGDITYPRIGYFSTPNKFWNGQPIGIANQRDNVRVINNTAYTVANFKDTTGCTYRAGEGRYADELTAFQYAYVTGGSLILGCPNALVRTDGLSSFAGTRSYYQTTSGGDIEYHVNGSRAGQAFAIITPFYNRWKSFGYDSNNPLGYPIGFVSLANTNSCNGTQNRYQSFEGGSLVQHLSGSRNGQIFEVHGLIHRKWELKGFAGCPLGLPTSDETVAQRSGATGVTGVLNQFETGQIYYKSGAPEAYEVHGSIYATYVGMGGSTSWLGFPTSDEFIAPTGYPRSNFEGGYITWDGSKYSAFGNVAGCPAALTINSGLPINGSLQNGDCQRNSRFYDAYTFTGQTGQKIYITLNSTQFDTYLYLYRGTSISGIPWVSNDDGGGGWNSRIPASTGFTRLPSNGTYTILVSSYHAGATGSYSLSLTNVTTTNSNTNNLSPFDFDSDGKTDFSVFRTSSSVWHFYSTNKTVEFDSTQFGIPTDKIVPSDYDGDGRTDIAVFREGVWHLLRSTDGYINVPFGAAGDIPQPADYDGDGKAEIAVFRPSTGVWYCLNLQNNQYNIVQFGVNGDKPVVADYDGDKKADIAIYRPSNGQWWLLRSNLGVIVFQFGNNADKPVQGDYTGDKMADVAFYRPSTGEWFILRSENQTYYSYPFGIAEDLPSPGDYDGDEKADAAVFRPSNNTWYVQGSTSGILIQPFGQSGDKPVPNAFVR
jgi:hypothetical protein